MNTHHTTQSTRFAAPQSFDRHSFRLNYTDLYHVDNAQMNPVSRTDISNVSATAEFPLLADPFCARLLAGATKERLEFNGVSVATSNVEFQGWVERYARNAGFAGWVPPSGGVALFFFRLRCVLRTMGTTADETLPKR